MYRRRRIQRDIAFSFDSFLDLVANVVGIIIRLILVVWVGARSYGGMMPLPSPPAAPPEAIQAADPKDPLEDELERSRRELAEAQALLLAELRALTDSQDKVKETDRSLHGLVVEEKDLKNQAAVLAQAVGSHRQSAAGAALTLEELRERCAKVRQALVDLRNQPSPKKLLRYRTPISQPLHSEELMFECRNGRVAFIDIHALLEDVKRGLDEKAKALHRQWTVTGVAGPVGPFELRYELERERGPFEGALGSVGPDPNASFRYNIDGWQVEPSALSYGETLEQALNASSDFRQVVDRIDPHETAVTFWVYPDSFDTFRRLRDYLYEREVVVAGRPLPDGIPISSSRHGSASRGQ